MNWILGKLAGGKLVGAFLAIQAFLSGRKSYLAGSILLLQGFSCLIDQVVGLGGLSDAINMTKGLGQSECLQKIAEGLGIIGIRGGIAKANAAKEG